MTAQTKLKQLVKWPIIAVFLITCMVVIGCDENDGREISATNIGPIISVTPAVVNYREGSWMSVATTSAVVCISPTEPIYLGKTAYIREFASGRLFLSWDGSKYMYAINR